MKITNTNKPVAQLVIPQGSTSNQSGIVIKMPWSLLLVYTTLWTWLMASCVLLFNYLLVTLPTWAEITILPVFGGIVVSLVGHLEVWSLQILSRHYSPIDTFIVRVGVQLIKLAGFALVLYAVYTEHFLNS